MQQQTRTKIVKHLFLINPLNNRMKAVKKTVCTVLISEFRFIIEIFRGQRYKKGSPNWTSFHDLKCEKRGFQNI